MSSNPTNADEEYEYAVSCGKHEMCDPAQAQPLFGIFKTAAEARKRADFLHGRVMVRRIGGWQPWPESVDAGLGAGRG